MTKSKDAGSFERVRDERELTDEIWLLAVDAAYQRNLMHLVQGLSRSDVLAWYFGEYPEMRRFVDRHIEAGTCDAAVAELRIESEKFRQWRIDQMGPIHSSPRSEWMKPFRMEPKEIPTRAKIELTASQKPKQTNLAVRKWMEDRVSNWPDNKTPPSEQEDWEAVRRHFESGLTRDEFRIVRKDLTPEEWRKQGPRKLCGRVKNIT